MMVAALNAQQERARKQRKTLFNKAANNGSNRSKQTAAKKDNDKGAKSMQAKDGLRVSKDDHRGSKTNLLATTIVSDFSEFLSVDSKVTTFESNEERWQHLTTCLLRRYQEANRSVNTFPQSIIPFFKEVEFHSGVTLSAQEKRVYYSLFFRRASAAGVLQSLDAEEILSSPELEFNITRHEVLKILNEKLQSRNVAFDSSQGAYIDCDNDNLNFEFFLSLACDLKRRKQLIMEKESARSMSSLTRVLPLDPESTPKQCWDFFCMLLLLYCSFSVPYGIAFADNSSGGPMSVVDGFGLAVDILFMVDICFSFVTAIEIDGVYIRDLRSVAINYLRTWFAADFAGSFPFDTVISFAVESQGSLGSTNFIRVLRFVRMLKLIRAVRLVSRLNKLKHRDGLEVLAPIIGISTSIFILVFTAHLLGCFFTMLLSIQPDSVNWLTNYDPELSDADDQTRYVVALYWAMISVTTMGYGDVVPVTNIERIFGIGVALVGAVVFSFCMGNVASLISQVPTPLFSR
jgi:voltage-gated potassium channel Kch